METNELQSLETFPKSYEACFLESCSVKENCLHHLYFKLQPSTNTWGGAIYPSALLPENLVNGCCKKFQDRKLVTCYAGFAHFFDEVRRKDLPTLRNEIYSYFRGRSNFYRYGNAENGYLFTHQMAEDIKVIFKKYGYDAPRYDRTFESLSFHEQR